jgi:hypothetical protein
MLDFRTLQAANLTLPAEAAKTIFAPTDEAFAADDFRNKTGFAVGQLLGADYQTELVQVW